MRLRFLPKAVPAVVLMVAAAPTFAQKPPAVSAAASPAFKAMIGKWEISSADHDRACALTFRADPVAGVFKLELDNTCPAQLPELRDVAGWSIGGLDLVRLMDRKGKAVMEFSEVESGIFEAQRPGEGVFLLQTAAAAAAAPAGISLDQMAGDWNVVRGASRTVCTITLTNAAAGADAFALKLKPGCDTFVTRFGPAAWYMERGELVLKSKSGRLAWRFAADDPTNWQRIPEGSEPVSLVRR